jgi:uncharacterized protein
VKLHLEQTGARYRITGYAPGRVIVNGETMTHSLIVSENELVRDWPPRSWEELTASHLKGVLELGPEVVLLGSGVVLRFPEAAVLAPLVEAGIGVEVMDTGAACRTFNVLVAEGRRVAAALVIPGD